MSEAPRTLADWQEHIRRMYGWKDERRGAEGTFLWFMEEVGELAAALREADPAQLEGEFADVLAWLTTLANVAGIDLDQAIEKKFGTGCPGCRMLVCACGQSVKP